LDGLEMLLLDAMYKLEMLVVLLADGLYQEVANAYPLELEEN
jgi:hypothetical protein